MCNIKVVAFLLLQLSQDVVGKNCNKPPTVTNGKIEFSSLNGNMQPSTLDTEYDAKGLQPFFNLANSFMNTVQGKKLSDEFRGLNFKDITADENRDKLIKYETPVAVAAGFGVLFMILMPIVGLCFCCCRCCGKCGGKKYQHHKAADKHSRCVIMTVILFIVAVFMLCGTLFMFVTNNRTHETAQNFGDTYVKAIDNVVSVANSTKNTMVDVSDELVPCLIGVIEGEIHRNGIDKHFGVPIQDFVKGNVSNIFDTGDSLASTVDSLKTVLDDIKSKSDDLKTEGSNLQTSLNNIATNLESAKTDCNGDQSCIDTLENFKSKVVMEVDFNNLPNIDQSISDINEAYQKNISKSITDARKLVDDIPNTVYTKAKPHIDDVQTQINDLQTEVEKQVKEISDNIDSSITKEEDKFKDYRKDFDQKSENFKYENYRYYAYIGLSGLMAFIVLLLAGGMTLGVCGYNRDNSPSHRTQTATCGGNCLMAAVGFMFIFSFFLMLFCVVWYALGIHLYFVCRDLKDASIFDTIISDEFNLVIEDGKSEVSVQGTLDNCRNNLPLYQSIGGPNVFNISSKFSFRDLTTNIDQVLANIQFDLTDQTILSQDVKDALNKIQTTDVSNTDFNQFFTTLNTSITKFNLTDVSRNVTNAANDFRTAGNNGVAGKLDSIANDLKNIDSNTIPNIVSKANALKPSVDKLQTLVPGLQDSGKTLLEQLTSSEYFIQSGTTPKIIELVSKLAALIIDYLIQGTDFVISQATTNLLRCKPVADLYDGLLSTLLCDDIVQNANGFWLALGWCLLFFIPAIIFSVRLAKYYRRMEYDSGLDQTFENPPYNDKIPLQTYQSTAQRNTDNNETAYMTDAGRSLMVADELDYDHHAPPPYQQHQNQGYANH